MQLLLHIMLVNAVSTAVLAIIALPASLIFRKPAVTRALWIIVLLKLLMPPILTIPLDRLMPKHSIPVKTVVAPVVETPITLEDLPPPAPSASVTATSAEPRNFFPELWLVWAIASALVLAVGLSRIWALSRILRLAQLAPANIQWQASEIADRFGITRAPQVWFVSGVVCPALWAFCRSPRVIVPVDLWERLDERQRQTLLTHELAHLKRRDHWVRLLEFTTTILYWWHPAVWFARRQIHDCEEQCCDAWVLWAMPASAHSYGSALLEAVDYVSTYRPMRPALAAGLGEFRHLKRRLLMIKQGTVSRTLSRTGLASMCAAAALALPLAPGLAQQTPQSSALPAGPTPGAPGGQSPRNEQPEVSEARAKVAQAQAELQRARAELAQATSRLALLEHGSGGVSYGSGGGGGTGNFSRGYDVGSSAPSSPAPVGTMPGSPPASALAAPSTPGTDPTVESRGRLSMSSDGVSTGTIRTGGMTGARSIAGGGGVGYGSGGGLTLGQPVSPGAGGAIAGLPARRTESERRLQGLEQQMKELMDQLRELKDMQRQQQNPTTPPATPPGTTGELPGR